jgi:hypothetical protein
LNGETPDRVQVHKKGKDMGEMRVVVLAERDKKHPFP